MPGVQPNHANANALAFDAHVVGGRALLAMALEPKSTNALCGDGRPPRNHVESCQTRKLPAH